MCIRDSWWIERLPERDVWKRAMVATANGAYLDRPEHELLRLRGVIVFPARLGDAAKKSEALFGMRRLSQRLKGIPQPHGALTLSEMTQRVQDRAPYLVAYLGKLRDEQGREELRTHLDRVRVTGATALHAKWHLDDVSLDEQEVSRLMHEDGECWHLYLKTSTTPPNLDPAWEDLARVILLACGLSPTERASDVKDILIYEEDCLSEKL